MQALPNPFNTLKLLGGNEYYYALSALESAGLGPIRRLPISLRIVLEALLRHCDGQIVQEKDIIDLCNYNAKQPHKKEIPFIVSRVILQDFTGVPLLVDLAAMRDAVAACAVDPQIIEPKVPVDLIIDHSVQVDRSGTPDAFIFNLEVENQRNYERYAFLKWGQQAFETFRVVPPGIGIVHQINLEHIATLVTAMQVGDKTILFPDTLVGTDSHTTMINGLGVVGWGVGGIEAEASMLGLPANLQTPEVIGVYVTGALSEGVTATDLTLRVTELLRKAKVVDKFVEFFGPGVANLSVADRATIGNMSPEYGATMGFFPIDEMTLDYLQFTGRSQEQIDRAKRYLQAQGLFGIPGRDDIDYTAVLDLDLASIVPSVAGPKRPQDRIELPNIKSTFQQLIRAPFSEGGYGKSDEKAPPRVCIHADGYFSLTLPHETGGTEEIGDVKNSPSWSEEEMVTNRPMTKAIVDPGYNMGSGNGGITCDAVLTHGSVAIAAITSCTNTSNPNVMLAAGLLAKKAVERGLKVNRVIKTSLAPGSRVVTDYLDRAGLQPYLDALGFQLVAYGCTTCIGNSGPLEENIEKAIKEHDLIAASVLSGNRNFEARIHSTIKANFLMSPPLVVAFALAGRVDIDMDNEPLGYDSQGKAVFLRDIWPTNKEIAECVYKAVQPEMFQKRYSRIGDENPVWNKIPTLGGPTYTWDHQSTYIQKPPYFEDFSLDMEQKEKVLTGLRALAIFGNSVTTDHISPAGGFRANLPAGKYLLSLGVKEEDFNSYGSRRGNHHVMVRGTFANVRIRNKMAGDKEGGYTLLMPEKAPMSIFDACEQYRQRNVPLIIFAGKDYGMGSSRDWAAKGPALLGVHVVVAASFERIHRSNLIGMGVLPLQFTEGTDADTLGLTGEEEFALHGFSAKPQEEVMLEITHQGQTRHIPLASRLDNSTEVECYKGGGILPFVLRHLLKS
jgi:aconitate hydratase